MTNLLPRLRKVAYWIIKPLAVFFSSIIPKSPNVWVFGAWAGKRYSDNPRYLFEYIARAQPQIRPIWLAKDKNIIKMVRHKGYEAYHMFSLQGFWFSMRAKIAVICQLKKVDLNYLALSSQTKLIQLWHGIPLKKIGYDDKLFDPENKHTPQENYDLIISTSNKNQATFSTAFGVPKERIKITGYPRNDVFIKKAHEKIITGNDSIKGIYMPTLRGGFFSKFNLFEKYGFDVTKASNFLEQRNIVLYMKLHPLNLPADDFLEKIKLTKNLFFYNDDDDDDDIYNKLQEFNFLITDYSSIYFDYLLLDRPIIFTPFDIKEYINQDREMYYLYDDVTPGPKAENWTQALKCIDQAFFSEDNFKDAREKICNRFHKFCDDNSSIRVYNEIENLIKPDLK